MNMKKFTSLLLAAMLAAAPLTGCQKPKKGATLTLPLENSYRSDEITHARGWDSVSAIGDCMYFVSYTAQQKSTVLLEYNTVTGASREITPACEKERNAACTLSASIVMELEDGKRGILCEEYQSKKYSAPEIKRRCIEVYDKDWTLLETKELPEDFCEDVSVNRSTTAWDAQGNFYVYVARDGEARIDTYNSEFEQYGSIPLSPDGIFINFVKDREDNVYMYRGDAMDNGHFRFRLCRLSASERTMEDVDADINCDNVSRMPSGAGEFDFYYVGGNDLYGVNAEGRKKVMNFINSDFQKEQVTDCTVLDNGKIVVGCFVQNRQTYWLAEPLSEEDRQNTKFITLAAVGTYSKLVDAVMDFNREYNGWRIAVFDYAEGESYEQIKEGLAKMQQDMRDGFVADLICTDGLNYESFASKGFFADWYSVLEENEKFSRSDYLENFFRAYEYKGELQRLGFDFTIYTQLAKTEHVGEQQGLSMTEFTKLCHSQPDGRKPYQYYWYMFDSQTGVVDKQGQKCYYDTPEYRDVMQILNGTAEQRENVTNHELDFREDKAVFYPTTLRTPIDYHSIRKAVFLDAPLTFVGEPMYERKGNGGQFKTTFTLSVNSQTTQTEGICNFAMHLLSEGYQKKLGSSMPIHKGALSYALENAQRQSMHTFYFGAQQVNVGAATQEEMTDLLAYIEGIEAAYSKDTTIENIVMEETDMFLAGDQSAEQATRMMQSRVSIYLSEQS